MPDHYRAPWWLPGGHLQTIYPFFCARLPRRVSYRRERWDTPDGDFIDLDWLDGASNAPLAVLFHGLESDSHSHYAVSIMAGLQQKNWRGVVVHFRGCSGEPNRLARAYHSGDSSEIDWILRRLKTTQPETRIFAVGVSLGGNALLKYLGEQGTRAEDLLHAAAAISVPLDLAVAGATLDKGFNRVTYTAHFLKSLKHKVGAKVARNLLTIDPGKLRKAHTLHAFDDLYTAPVHGFRDANDYWRLASSLPLLKQIALPTLIINARNDPFMPASVLPGVNQVSTAVTLEYPEQGGHAGFITGPFPGRLTWLPQQILNFFAANDDRVA
jgi:predicted alpha/beta-fold hydrolase